MPKHHLVARISSRITTVIRVVNNTEETIAVLPSHSQFRCTIHSYLHLHGLVLETSIYHWQDQPGSYSFSQWKIKSFRSHRIEYPRPSGTSSKASQRVEFFIIHKSANQTIKDKKSFPCRAETHQELKI